MAFCGGDSLVDDGSDLLLRIRFRATLSLLGLLASTLSSLRVGLTPLVQLLFLLGIKGPVFVEIMPAKVHTSTAETRFGFGIGNGGLGRDIALNLRDLSRTTFDPGALCSNRAGRKQEGSSFLKISFERSRCFDMGNGSTQVRIGRDNAVNKLTNAARPSSVSTW